MTYTNTGDRMKIEKRLKGKVFEYCDNNKDVNIRKVYNYLVETELWNVSAVLYGMWVQENSTYESTELSEQEW